jgi:hypothetical protein
MRCDELRYLLKIYGGQDDLISDFIAAHIRSCRTCNHGIELLSNVLISYKELTCEECRERFPDYYEATHKDYPMVHMPSSEMAAVALHLGSCASCKEQYELLELLSEIEERDEIVD